MKRKSYWCPKCGRMFMGRAAFMKHVDSKKCKINQEKDEREDAGDYLADMADSSKATLDELAEASKRMAESFKQESNMKPNIDYAEQ